MRKYETTYIIDGSVNESVRESVIEKYRKLLTDNGAVINRIVRWGRRQLAYEIKKQTHGYYVIMYYEADPGIISRLHREMDINEHVFRYMTLRSDGKHPDYIRDEGEPASTERKSSRPQRTVESGKPDAVETSDVSVGEDAVEDADGSGGKKDAGTGSVEGSAGEGETEGGEGTGTAADGDSEEDTESNSGKEAE